MKTPEIDNYILLVACCGFNFIINVLAAALVLLSSPARDRVTHATGLSCVRRQYQGGWMVVASAAAVRSGGLPAVR